MALNGDPLSAKECIS